MAGHGEDILLGDEGRLILEKFGVEVGFRGDSWFFLWRLRQNFRR